MWIRVPSILELISNSKILTYTCINECCAVVVCEVVHAHIRAVVHGPRLAAGHGVVRHARVVNAVPAERRVKRTCVVAVRAVHVLHWPTTTMTSSDDDYRHKLICRQHGCLSVCRRLLLYTVKISLSYSFYLTCCWGKGIVDCSFFWLVQQPALRTVK